MLKDGNKYVANTKKKLVACEKGEFPISAVGLDHGHIYGMVKDTIEAGANIKWVWDKDPKKIEEFVSMFPDAKVARSAQEVYDCKETKMIHSSIIANERWKIGEQTLKHGKHYMSDKTGFTELSQIGVAKELVNNTGLKWSVCFSERLQVESAILTGQIIQAGHIGNVIQVINLAPHRLGVATRPDWFFNKEQYGGILCDIGSHQIDQMLFYTGSKKGEVVYSQVGNFNNLEYPELEDFGDCTLSFDTGATGYCRLDWFTPEGLETWGDGRLFVLGTEGYIEVRKYVNVGLNMMGNNVFLVNGNTKELIDANDTTGFPYFSELILDCLNGTDEALPQEHVFETSRLAVEAEQNAIKMSGFK